jgi:hypothetical protein
VTSKAVYYETTSGTIVNISPYKSYYSGSVSGDGNYYGAPLSDFRIKYSVKRDSDNKYLQSGGTWGTSLYWINAPLSQNPGVTSGYTFSSNGGGGYGYYNVYIEWYLYNVKSGRILASRNITAPNYYIIY